MVSARFHLHSFCALAGLLVLSVAGAASASIITIVTPSGATVGGQSVDASVTFTFAANQIIVTLANQQADPRSVGQNLSGLSFAIDTGQTAGTIVSDIATQRIVARDGSYTDGGSVSAGWALSADGNEMVLDVLGAPVGPAHTIIGPAGGPTYANANNSITGNGPHNPFLAESATWTLYVPGVTDESLITGATFWFGTTPGSGVNIAIPPTGVPEPATMGVLLSAGAIWLSRRRGRRPVELNRSSVR